MSNRQRPGVRPRTRWIRRGGGIGGGTVRSAERPPYGACAPDGTVGAFPSGMSWSRRRHQTPRAVLTTGDRTVRRCAAADPAVGDEGVGRLVPPDLAPGPRSAKLAGINRSVTGNGSSTGPTCHRSPSCRCGRSCGSCGSCRRPAWWCPRRRGVRGARGVGQPVGGVHPRRGRGRHHGQGLAVRTPRSPHPDRQLPDVGHQLQPRLRRRQVTRAGSAAPGPGGRRGLGGGTTRGARAGDEHRDLGAGPDVHCGRAAGAARTGRGPGRPRPRHRVRHGPGLRRRGQPPLSGPRHVPDVGAGHLEHPANSPVQHDL